MRPRTESRSTSSRVPPRRTVTLRLLYATPARLDSCQCGWQRTFWWELGEIKNQKLFLILNFSRSLPIMEPMSSPEADLLVGKRMAVAGVCASWVLAPVVLGRQLV